MEVNVKINNEFLGKPLESLSEEEFFNFCAQQESIQIERNPNGEIIFMTPSFPNISRLIMKIATRIVLWAEKDKTGEVYDSSAGFTLPNKAVRAPDICWLSHKRWNESMKDEANKKRFPHVVPEFVIEVRSNSDTMKRQKDKMLEYMGNGVLLGWLIDPKSEKIWIYDDQGIIKEKTFDDTLAGDKILKGLQIKLRDFI